MSSIQTATCVAYNGLAPGKVDTGIASFVVVDYGDQICIFLFSGNSFHPAFPTPPAVQQVYYEYFVICDQRSVGVDYPRVLILHRICA